MAKLSDRLSRKRLPIGLRPQPTEFWPSKFYWIAAFISNIYWYLISRYTSGVLIATLVLVVAATAIGIESLREALTARQEIHTVADEGVKDLQTSISVASKTLEDLEEKIASRRDIVSKLESELETLRSLIALHERQAEAVIKAMSDQIRKAEEASFRLNVTLTIISILVGVGLDELFRLIRRRRKQAQQSDKGQGHSV